MIEGDIEESTLKNHVSPTSLVSNFLDGRHEFIDKEFTRIAIRLVIASFPINLHENFGTKEQETAFLKIHHSLEMMDLPKLSLEAPEADGDYRAFLYLEPNKLYNIFDQAITFKYCSIDTKDIVDYMMGFNTKNPFLEAMQASESITNWIRNLLVEYRENKCKETRSFLKNLQDIVIMAKEKENYQLYFQILLALTMEKGENLKFKKIIDNLNEFPKLFSPIGNFNALYGESMVSGATHPVYFLTRASRHMAALLEMPNKEEGLTGDNKENSISLEKIGLITKRVIDFFKRNPYFLANHFEGEFVKPTYDDFFEYYNQFENLCQDFIEPY